MAPPGSILVLKKYTFSHVTINAKHEFHETRRSITFLFNKKKTPNDEEGVQYYTKHIKLKSNDLHHRYSIWIGKCPKL